MAMAIARFGVPRPPPGAFPPRPWGCAAPRAVAAMPSSTSFLAGRQFLGGLYNGAPRHRAGVRVCAALSGRKGGKGKAAKDRVVYVCEECGEDTMQWRGTCPVCGEWNTLKELRVPKEPAGSKLGGSPAARAVARAAPSRGGSAPSNRPQGAWVDESDGPQRLRDVGQSLEGDRWRMALPGGTGREVSRVLGGGVVPGSLVLVGGDPGVGKSTLMLQMAGLLAGSTGEGAGADDRKGKGSKRGEKGGGEDEVVDEELEGRTVLYVSGEESVEQLYQRARRMGVDAADDVYLYSATRVDSILAAVAELQPSAVVVDSIQTIYLDEVAGSAGSVSQVRECAAALLQCAKQTGTPIFLVGHVTKSGEIAGPRTLEHIVDVVLYLEGERLQAYRMLRGVKNRYGATDEVGVFEMVSDGLRAVANPSEMFLAHRAAARGVSSAVAVTLEGTRPLMVEIQALSQMVQEGGGAPRRMGNGVSNDRLFLILAVVSKRARLPVYSQDVIINVVGGLEVREPACDLAIAAAVASSVKDEPVPDGVAFVGEIGLGGELRPVPQIERRLAEASKLGFARVIMPAAGTSAMALDGRHAGVQAVRCATLREALQATFGGRGGRRQEEDLT